MDFALLPPEVNSARMYAGPGSGPMMAAASAWDALAAELQSTASSYQSAIAGLIAGPWLGPSAATMAAAAAPYVAWMRTTAAQAEQTANQATVAAAAYDAAFAETVPPPVVAANRSLLMALVATNLFGQNTPAIAATETQYAEMWAQDTAAMYSYAGASASATSLTPFSSPPTSTNSSGQANQAAAAAQAGATPAGNVQSAISSAQQALSAVPSALSNAASPAAADPSLLNLLDLASDLIAIFLDAPSSVAGLGIDAPLTSVSFPFDVVGALTGFHTDDIVSGWAGVQPWPGTAPVPPTPFPVITNLGSPVSAAMGEANTIGRMSVPTAWASAAPEIRLSAVALPATSLGSAAEASAGSAGSVFSQMALAGMAGRAMAGTAGTGGTGRRERIGERVGAPIQKPAEAPQPEPPAPPKTPPGGPITGIAAELRELASLRDSGILTDEEFTEQKRRLLPQ
ncbi:PPE family protein, SVP subgroup [Mycobacterium sp.]|uniref:PPE family protein, SVP subgroup n=1 Tax=Mycobacterium sp. TaxID=1785 RepID=UPI003F9A7561